MVVALFYVCHNILCKHVVSLCKSNTLTWYISSQVSQEMPNQYEMVVNPWEIIIDIDWKNYWFIALKALSSIYILLSKNTLWVGLLGLPDY